MGKKAHRDDILGYWAKENGWYKVAEAYLPSEVEKRRQEGVRAYNRRANGDEPETYQRPERKPRRDNSRR